MCAVQTRRVFYDASLNLFTFLTDCKDRAPLGMTTGQIRSDQITVSSSAPANNLRASTSDVGTAPVLHGPTLGFSDKIGSWCSDGTKEKWKDAYVEVWFIANCLDEFSTPYLCKRVKSVKMVLFGSIKSCTPSLLFNLRRLETNTELKDL